MNWRDSAAFQSNYLDIAVGIDPGGADAWSEQDCILQDLSIGAPPDLLNTAGQNWGITNFNPHALVAKDFAPFRSLLASAMRHAGAIRLDHILGLQQLYVVPAATLRGKAPTCANRWVRCCLLWRPRSQKNKCIVIGEDLGTVPEGFRETLASWGIWSYLVMMFERDGATFRPPERYPVQALATFATHDLPTFAGWLSGGDLRRKQAIGLDPGETEAERDVARAAIHDALAHSGYEDGIAGVARFELQPRAGW